MELHVKSLKFLVAIKTETGTLNLSKNQTDQLTIGFLDLNNMKSTVRDILSRGISLEESGINNWAFDKDGALQALCDLRAEGLPVLGGDVYEKKGPKIELGFDNWYCERNQNEDENDFVERSILKAESYIKSYRPVAESIVLFSLVV